jgi:hypothetical protein
MPKLSNAGVVELIWTIETGETHVQKSTVYPGVQVFDDLETREFSPEV